MDDISKEVLSEIEQDKIRVFIEDPTLFQAVKKYILAVVYKQGVVNKGEEYKGTVNFALNLAWGATQQNGMPRTDEELGQNLRSLTYATQLVESGFSELLSLKKVVILPEDENNPSE